MRIANVTSVGHKMFAPKVGIDFHDINQEKGTPWTRYGQSKLANILHTKQLNESYGPGKGGIWITALHPGNIYTDLSKNARFLGLPSRLSKALSSVMNMLGVYIPADQGAYNTVYCVASGDMKVEWSGKYFVPFGKVEVPSANAQDLDMAKKLWDWTLKEFDGKGLL